MARDRGVTKGSPLDPNLRITLPHSPGKTNTLFQLRITLAKQILTLVTQFIPTQLSIEARIPSVDSRHTHSVFVISPFFLTLKSQISAGLKYGKWSKNQSVDLTQIEI